MLGLSLYSLLDSISFYQLPSAIAINPFWCKRVELRSNCWFPIVFPERHSGCFGYRSWSRPNPWGRRRRLGGSLSLSQAEDDYEGKKGNSHHLLFLSFVLVFDVCTRSGSTSNWYCQGSRTLFIWVLCKAPIWPQNAKSLSWLWSQSADTMAEELCSVLQALHCGHINIIIQSSWPNQYLEIPSR